MGMGFASGGGLFSCLSFIFPGSGGGRVGFLPGFSTLILPRPRILFRRKEVQCAPGFSLPLPGHYSLFLLILQRFITYVVLGEGRSVTFRALLTLGKVAIR